MPAAKKQTAIVLHQWERQHTARAFPATDDRETIKAVGIPVAKITKFSESDRYRNLLLTSSGGNKDAAFRTELWIGKDSMFVTETVAEIAAMLNASESTSAAPVVRVQKP
jgi:hypothetical protein